MDYEKLIKRIKKAYLYAQTDSTKAVLEEILPELKESEDERIRKELIAYHRSMAAAMNGNRSCVHEAWIAWLEKQSKENMIEALRMEYEKGKADVREQFEKERLAHCDTLTPEQAQIESDFVTSHLKEHNRTPTFIDAIEYGMKLQEQKLSNLESIGYNWSEEDERIYHSLLADIRASQNSSTNTLESYYNEQIDWLKSLKERIKE